MEIFIQIVCLFVCYCKMIDYIKQRTHIKLVLRMLLFFNYYYFIFCKLNTPYNWIIVRNLITNSVSERELLSTPYSTFAINRKPFHANKTKKINEFRYIFILLTANYAPIHIFFSVFFYEKRARENE